MRAVVLSLLLIPLAAGQAHEHGTSPVRIATDLNAEGLALVGHPAHFDLVAFGDDEVPDFHQDLPVRVWFNDALLWEQTVVTGHDYDGINALAIAFPAPGTWRVEALAEGKVIAQRNGTVVPADGAAAIDHQHAQEGGLQTFTYRLADPGTGATIDHVDAWFELWRDGMLWFRTHTHTHEEAQQIQLALPAGEYAVRITGYVAFPTATGPRFAPVVHEEQVSIAGGLPSLPDPAAPSPPTAANAAVQGTNTSPYRLVGTYDPFTRVGPDTLQHLNALVVDEHGDAVQHVDFEATLHGPGGVLFASQTLHEYDGVYELATRQTQPGTYWLDVTASRGDWSDAITLPYAVLPPAMATVAGPQIVTLSGTPGLGAPGDIEIKVANPAGAAFAHGEIEVQVRPDPHAPPLVHAKLHTHSTGTFPFRLAVASSSPHALVLTPFPLDAQPVLGYHRDSLGTPLAFDVAAQSGPGFPAGDPLLPETGGPDDAAVPAGLPLLALVGLLLLRRKA